MRYQRHLFILRWHYCEICSVILVLDSAHDRRDNWLVRFQQLIRPQRDSLVGSYWFLFYFYWCKSNYLYLNGIPFEKVLIQPLHFAKFLKKPIFVLRGHLQSRNLETTHLGHSYESFFFVMLHSIFYKMLWKCEEQQIFFINAVLALNILHNCLASMTFMQMLFNRRFLIQSVFCGIDLHSMVF